MILYGTLASLARKYAYLLTIKIHRKHRYQFSSILSL